MDSTLVSSYRLGIRLRQATLAHKSASGNVVSAPLPLQSIEDVKHTLGRLGAAFQLWSQGVDIGERKKRVDVLIKQVGEEWDAICRLPWGSRVESLGVSTGASKPASRGRFKTSQGAKV